MEQIKCNFYLAINSKRKEIKMTTRKDVKMFCLLLSLVLTLSIVSMAEGADSDWCTDASTETFLEVLENNLDITPYVYIEESGDDGYSFWVAKENDVYLLAGAICSIVLPADSLRKINACLDKNDYAIVKKVTSGETVRYHIYPRCQPVESIYLDMFGLGYGGMSGGALYSGMYGGITPYSGVYGATDNYATGFGGIPPYGELFGGLSGLFGLSGGLYGTHPVDSFSGIPGRLDGGNWNITANQYNPILGLKSPGTSFLPNTSQATFLFGQPNGSFLSSMAPQLNGAPGGTLPLFSGLNTTLPNVLSDAIDASAEPTREAQFFSPFRPQFSNIPNRNHPFLNRFFPW